MVDTQTWQRVAKHRIIVRPQRSTVSDFCTELTGLTQSDVDAGIGFADACAQLRDDLRAGSRSWGSWGDYDRKQFERQCSPGGTPYPFSSRHVNIKQRFADAYGLPRGIGMAQALKKARLPLEGRHHRGDDDAWNIGALAIHLAGRGHPPLPGDPGHG